MHRRLLLRSALGLSALPWVSSAGAAMRHPRMLLVYLRGGYDATNLLVPIASDFYVESRPNIAIGRPGSSADAAVPLDSHWGLHPALRTSVLPLYERGQAVFIPFAGTHDASRSHFETQDAMEWGHASGVLHGDGSGFLNRLAQELSGARAQGQRGARPMAFTEQLSPVLRGPLAVPNVGLRSLARSAFDARQTALINTMYQAHGLQQRVQEGFAVREEVTRGMTPEMLAANRNAVSTRGFEAEARRVAQLMRDSYDLGFVDVGGWDTHVSQGGATGALATRLDELGRGLAAFADEMGSTWDDTVVVVMSEFGRTFRENGNRGTDHGHGSVYWVLGGGVRGGRVAGEQVELARGTLHQDRDTPVLNEYRSLLGGLFQRMYGLSDTALARVFPGTKASDLGLV